MAANHHTKYNEDFKRYTNSPPPSLIRKTSEILSIQEK